MERLKKLSDNIVNYSLKVKEGQKVLITVETEIPNNFVKQLVKDIVKVRGIPYVKILSPEVTALEQELMDDNKITLKKEVAKFEVDLYDCFINIKYNLNDYEFSNVNKEMRIKLSKELEKIDDVRINKRRWVLLNYPSKLDAYKAKMKYDLYYDYAIDAMIYDYSKMQEDIKPLKELMEKTDKVRIVGPNTDITFSIKGIPARPCVGNYNIPDGEIYTAPVKESVNGIITYNTLSPYQGNVYENISLRFKDGKIIEAKCDSDNDKLNEIFDTDEGARYVGEFAIGLNPIIRKPMGDILFDEKIIGSIHFTPGRAYDDADNGNKSGIHWDLVLIQREEYGGGELYFDDVLIRKDGKFVIDSLKPLNYDIN